MAKKSPAFKSNHYYFRPTSLALALQEKGLAPKLSFVREAKISCNNKTIHANP